MFSFLEFSVRAMQALQNSAAICAAPRSLGTPSKPTLSITLQTCEFYVLLLFTMSDEHSKIAEFMEVSQTTPDEARELLEEANWNVQEALGLFYNGIEGEDQGEVDFAAHETAVPAATRGGAPRPSSSATASKRFATLADLNQDSPAHSSEEDDDNLFTGGGKSGLAVQNPDSASANSARLINDIFRHSRGETGRRPEDEDEDEDDGGFGDDEDRFGSPFNKPPGSKKSGKARFQGTGITLGSDDVPSRRIDSQDSASSQPAGRLPRVNRRLTFWRNGFSVEDGPLYFYDDPANVNHLRAIRAGRAPVSLLNVENGQDVHVHVIRNLDEDYKPPKPKQEAFVGTGVRLGSPVPGEPINSAATTPAASIAPPTTSSSNSSSSIAVPTSGNATVQLRLGDGSTHRLRLQSTGPVQQLYDFVDSLDSNSVRAYVLQTTFPNKELSDRQLTLKEAGVVGAVVVQKWL